MQLSHQFDVTVRIAWARKEAALGSAQGGTCGSSSCTLMSAHIKLHLEIKVKIYAWGANGSVKGKSGLFEVSDSDLC